MSPQLVRKPLHYDRQLRRLWIRGQRCHHGATGAFLAAAAGAAALKAQSLSSAALIAAGTVLMVHDRHDRSIWFQRGWQNQP